METSSNAILATKLPQERWKSHENRSHLLQGYVSINDMTHVHPQITILG
jgi:hypothetical protein